MYTYFQFWKIGYAQDTVVSKWDYEEIYFEAAMSELNLHRSIEVFVHIFVLVGLMAF